MVKKNLLTALLGIISISLSSAQKPFVQLWIEEDPNSSVNRLIIEVVNESNEKIYIPYMNFSGSVMLVENGKNKNFGWCYQNRIKCPEEPSYLKDYELHRNRSDSILKSHHLDEFIGPSQSFYFLRRGERLSYSIPLCYLVDKKGDYVFRFDNNKFIRCSEHIHLNQFRYGLTRRFRFLDRNYKKPPKSILGYRRFNKTLKSQKFRMHF